MGFIKKHIDLGLVGHEPLILHPALSSLADEQGGPRVKRSGRTQEVNWGWAINPGFPLASHQTNMEPDLIVGSPTRVSSTEVLWQRGWGSESLAC